jgi:hypothetical protein
MRAHRVRVRISESHELRLQLPSDFPQGEAEVIVLEATEEGSVPRSKHSIDELLDGRLVRLPGVGPVTLDDMEKAISEGASGRGGA